MIRGAALADTILLVDVQATPTGESVFGDPEFAPDAGVTVRAMVQPLDATEDEINRDVRINRYMVTVEADTPVTGLKQIEWDGDTYDVMGEPKTFKGTLGDTHHLEFEVRGVKG